MMSRPTTQEVAKEFIKVFKTLKNGTKVTGDVELLHITNEIIRHATIPQFSGVGGGAVVAIELEGKKR